MKSKLLILFFALVSVIIVFNHDQQDKNLFTLDRGGYYLYLPAIFINHDLAWPKLTSNYDPLLVVRVDLVDVNCRQLNKYPVGTAIFEMPLFLLAHAYCLVTHQFNPDGLSMPYQLAGIFSTLFWVAAGLFVLRGFLLRYFSDNVTAITLLFVAFGTNLYAYTAFDPAMSHPFSFFLFTCLLYLTDTWYSKPPAKYVSLLTGMVLGFILIVRPVNIIAAVIPLFWKVDSLAALKQRIAFFGRQYFHLLLAIFSFLCVAFIQLSYWKYITGHWIFYSYQDEGFDFRHPHILKGLFSYRKGWFVYTPVALTGLLGCYFLWKKDKQVVPGLILFFTLMIYAVFSWRQWWYGGSFGCRALIETLAFLSLPIAAATEYFYNAAGRIKKTSFFALMLSLVALNLFQTYQYSMGLIHWSRMTKEYYWHVFGQTTSQRGQYEKYLIPENEEGDPEK